MSNWTMNENASRSCCQGCEERRPGFHDVKVCMAWAAEVARRKKEKEQREKLRPVHRLTWEQRRVL